MSEATTADDETVEESEETEESEQFKKVESRDDIPNRDELVRLRRNQGLTNEEIAEEHLTEFSPRQIGMFIKMYDIVKGWKDEEYLQSQIDAGATPEELAEQWPVTAGTVKTWMDRHGIEENPVPDLFVEATEVLTELAEEIDDSHLAERYRQYAEKISGHADDYFD